MGTRASMNVAAIDERGNLRRTGPGSAPYPSLPYAGPMRLVSISGRVGGAGAAIETEHELGVEVIHLRWRMTLPKGGGWEIVLPSYGKSATVVAERHSGRLQLLPGRPAIALDRVGKVLIQADAGSYTLEVLDKSPPATLRLVAVPPGSEAANSGPVSCFAAVHGARMSSSSSPCVCGFSRQFSRQTHLEPTLGRSRGDGCLELCPRLRT